MKSYLISVVSMSIGLILGLLISTTVIVHKEQNIQVEQVGQDIPRIKGAYFEHQDLSYQNNKVGKDTIRIPVHTYSFTLTK